MCYSSIQHRDPTNNQESVAENIPSSKNVKIFETGEGPFSEKLAAEDPPECCRASIGDRSSRSASTPRDYHCFKVGSVTGNGAVFNGDMSGQRLPDGRKHHFKADSVNSRGHVVNGNIDTDTYLKTICYRRGNS